MLDDRSSLNAYAELRPVGAALMFSWEKQSDPDKKFRFIYGIGMHTGYAFIEIPGFSVDNNFAFGIDAIVGVKYALGDLALGLQYQPGYDLIGKWAGSLADINLIVELDL